jgi:integrase
MARKLTDTLVRSLAPPAAGQRVVWDGALPRFGLRLAAGGARAWVIKYKVRGRSRWLTLGSYPLISLAGARKKAKRQFARVVQGEDPAAERRTANEAATFGKLAQDYIEKHAKPKKRSWKEDQRILTKYVPRSWQATLARDITRREVREVVERLAADTPIMANRVLACLRKVFNFGIDREAIEANPAARIARPSAERQRDRVLSADELRRLWGVLDGAGRTGLILKLMLYTAQRGGEVKAIRWADVDLDAAWWTVPASIAKNRLSNRVPLSAPAVALLRDLQTTANGAPSVFASTSRSGHAETIKRTLDRVRRATGKSCGECRGCRADKGCRAPRNMIDFVPHDLRRTVATFLTSELGVSRLVVSKLLNHVETGVTKVYDRASYDREKQAALIAWAARLEQIVTSESVRAKVVPLARA